jgi:hypothetical protein
MAQFLNEALSSSVDDLPAILESAKQLTDFWPTLKMKLYAEPELVSNSPAACHLLASAFEHDSVVDLSPFTLSIEGIERILLLKSHLKSLTTLSLSGNQFVDEITLQEILTKYPGLRILQLLNTPQLKLETKVAMARTANQLQILDVSLLFYVLFPRSQSDFSKMHDCFTYQRRLYTFLTSSKKPTLTQIPNRRNY